MSDPYSAPKSKAPLDSSPPSSRVGGWVDAASSVLFVVLFLLAQLAAKQAAEEAVRLYGRNVDSGALEHSISVIYFAPSALLLALASISILCRWRFGRALHWLAWSWVILPLLIAVGLAAAA